VAPRGFVSTLNELDELFERRAVRTSAQGILE
jgi:hypothetical protein